MALAEKITHFYSKDDVEKKWYLVDAKDKTLGRIASQVAHILRGKHRPEFTPNSDMGDFVIIINADQVKVTGKRSELKEYFRYTGYPGGARFDTFKELMKTKPTKVLEHAVKGMIPHTRLGRQIIKKLKVYTGPTHPHAAQKPELLNI